MQPAVLGIEYTCIKRVGVPENTSSLLIPRTSGIRALGIECVLRLGKDILYLPNKHLRFVILRSDLRSIAECNPRQRWDGCAAAFAQGRGKIRELATFRNGTAI